MLYRGIGSKHPFPHSPLTDGLLSSALARAGHAGSRVPGECVWGSTSIGQASQYTADGTAAGLLSLEPSEGAVVSWVPGRHDLLLEFGDWLNALRWDWEANAPDGLPRGTRAFVRDVAGDIGILDAYLGLKRQRAVCAALASAFVATLEVREVRFADGDDLASILAGHEGEVWITGPWRAEPLPDAPAAPSV